MSEKRAKETTILLRNQGKTVKLELFPATAWGGPAGCYRLRLDGCWHSPGGSKHEFIAPAGVAGFVVALVCGASVQPEECHGLRRGDRVRVPNGTGAYDKTFVSGPPILGLDGRWWVAVTGRDLPVAVDTLLRATGGDQ